MNIYLTFDVEQDLHSEKYVSLQRGIPLLLGLLNKYNILATFFVPAKLLNKFPNYFLNLEKQGHEIALHGLEHERFDNLPLIEKEKRIKESVKIYKTIFNKNPAGFRAPQHSIDEETLKILEKNNFLYDASYTPFNILQFLFFPRRFLLFIHGFFSSRKIKKIKKTMGYHTLKGAVCKAPCFLDDPKLKTVRLTPHSKESGFQFMDINKNFYEVPTSSFLIPFVSLPLRIFPWILLKVYLNILKLTHKNLVFYAHSWDFIELPKSKIDRYFNYRRLLNNLDKTIFYLYKGNNFLTINDLVKNENS